jgi:hypothetical protein
VQNGVYRSDPTKLQEEGDWTASAVVHSGDGTLAESSRPVKVDKDSLKPEAKVAISLSESSVTPGTKVTVLANVTTNPPLSRQQLCDATVIVQVQSDSGKPQEYAARCDPSKDTNNFEAVLETSSEGDLKVTATAEKIGSPEFQKVSSDELKLDVAEPPNRLPLLIALCLLAAAAALVVYNRLLVPRFPRDAVLAFPGSEIDLYSQAHGGLLSRQHVSIGNSGDDIDIGAESTAVELNATRSKSVQVKPLSEGVSLDSQPIEGSAAMHYGMTLRGPNWSADYRQQEPPEPTYDPEEY